MAKKRSSKGLRLYNRILKESTRLNDALPEDRKLSLKQRRELISKTIYPAYKNKKAKDIRIRDIRKSIERQYNRIPANPECDINLLPISLYGGIINWWDLDEKIGMELPKCILVKVTAGLFGNTNIFNTRNYGYHKSGVRQIVESIREEDPGSGEYFFTGYKKLRGRRPNDGTPENYYIDFVLHQMSQKGEIHNAGSIDEVEFQGKKTKRRIEKEKTIRQIILERTRNIKRRKDRRRSSRTKAQTFKKELRELATRIKRSKQKKKQNIDLFKRKQKAAIKMLERYYGQGDLTDNQFQKEMNAILSIKLPK